MSSALRCAASCCLVVPVIALGRAAPAQSSATPPAAAQPVAYPSVAAVASEQALRAGADVRYYPFGRLRAGDVVKVNGQKAGFARVATAGPAFAEFFGYVKFPKAGTSHLRRGADGRSATTTGPTDVFAPNLDARQDPASSWKPIVTLPADREVVVLETMEGDHEVLHRIALPAEAEGWIDIRALRAATPSEVAVFEAAVRELPQHAAAAPRGDVVPRTPETSARAAFQQGPVPSPKPAAPAAPAAIAQATEPAPADGEAVPPSPAQEMLEELEAVYARLLREPVETAEVGALRQLYLDLAKEHQQSRTVARFAQTRAQQLALWAEVQQRRVEMKDVLGRAVQTAQSAAVAKETIERLGPYVVVGRLDASTIYDGERLPKLLRVRDRKTGRTLAYVQPDARFDLAGLLGTDVGIMGEWAEDPGLKVTLVVPRRIDTLPAE
jgi:hypothetical protein